MIHILLYCPPINHKRSKLKSSVPVEEETALQYILTTPKLWILATGIRNTDQNTPHFSWKTRIELWLQWTIVDFMLSATAGYIKIKPLWGKYPIEIHGALSEVCDEFTGNSNTDSHWANCFHSGCVSLDNDPRSGRLKTSTDERSVKLVADALEEDCCAACEELSISDG